MDPGRARRGAPVSAVELRIDSIAAGGDGVGRVGGMVVFVPRSAPGDVLLVTTEKRQRMMRGRIERVLLEGPDRVAPPCDHYVLDRCGGCQLQHMRYESQLAAKATIVRDALERIGGLRVDTPAVTPSDAQLRYRRKLTLALRRTPRGWVAGLHRFDAPDEIFALADCPIADEMVLEDWRAVLKHSAYLPRARSLRAAVRAMDSGFAFTVEGGARWRGHERLFAEVGRMQELWWQPENQRRRLLHSRGDTHAAGASFVQVNPAVAGRVRDWVMQIVTEQRPRSAVDAYAGSGHIAAALAASGISVTAIEVDRDAARLCAARLPAGSRVIAQPVERALAGALPADVVVLNPPRGGLHQDVPALLRAQTAAPQRIIYVSCNPATLARDLKRLDGFRIASLRAFDMFPQTAHVETVCELAPAT